MPLSKQGTQRAVSILERILSQLEERSETGLENDDLEDVLRLQHAVDVMKSPLFAAILDVRNRYEQALLTEHRGDTNLSSTSSFESASRGELKLSNEPELQSQFISSDTFQNGHIGDSPEEESPSASQERLSQSALSAISSSSIDETSFHFQSTFVATKSHDQSHDASSSASRNGRYGSPLAGEGSNYKTRVKNRTDSTSSSSSERSLSKLAKRFSLGRKQSTGSGSSVSLADLARVTPRGQRLEVKGELAGTEMKSMMGSEFKGEDGVRMFVRKIATSSESSLSSMSSESVPLVKAKSLKDSSAVKPFPRPDDTSVVIANSEACEVGRGEGGRGEGVRDDQGEENCGATVINNDHTCEDVDGDGVMGEGVDGDGVMAEDVDGDGVMAEDVDGDGVRGGAVKSKDVATSKDILYFMRDKQSQARIQEILQSREPRHVMCVMSEGWSGDWRGCERLGVDLVGLSSTGVYVSKVYSESQSDSDRLQIGDQLLEVNSKKIENMASFEVAVLLDNIAVGSEVSLVVKFNPSGLADYQRLTQKRNKS